MIQWLVLRDDQASCQAPIDPLTLSQTRDSLLLILLHPFMPFITEEIWQDLHPGGESIVVAPMPSVGAIDADMLARFELAKEVISAIRNVRKEKNLAQREELELNVIVDDNYPAEFASVIAKMGNLGAINNVSEKDSAAAGFIVKTTQYFVPLGDKIDKEAEIKRLSDDLKYQEGFLQSVLKKLSNERFVNSAPEKVVVIERAKQSDAEAKIAALKEQIEALSK